MDKNEKKRKKQNKNYDPEKKARIAYYFKLSFFLILLLAAVAVGMFFYLRHEALGYRDQYVEELTSKMEESKNICYDTLESCGADKEILDNINTQYENAMKEEDIFQQYYLVDGILDYSLTSLYNVANKQHQDVALNGGQWIDFDDDIQTILDTQTSLETVKEQISSIDLDNYY